MKFLSLSLALLLLLSSTGCMGQAASLPEDEDLFIQTSAPVEDVPLEDVPLEDLPDGTEPDPDEELLPDPEAHPADADVPDGEQESADKEAPEEEAPYVRTIDPAKPMVALTFDDGPHKTCTDAILDILEENHALATFFEVGNNVRKYPEPVLRAYEMGCEVASHSNAHKNLGKMKKSAILRDLAAADEAFVAAGVPAPTLLRPPYGSVNTAVKSQTGRAVITWSVDTEDWKSRDAGKIVSYVQNYGDLDGHVVLMHSIYDTTVQAVEELVPWLQEQGYQLVTVTELMAYYYGELPQPDKTYGYVYFTKHGRTDTPLALPEAPVQDPEEAPAA